MAVDHKEAAVTAVSTLGFKNVTHPDNTKNQVWEWRTAEGRYIQVVVNNQNGRCLFSGDLWGANLEATLRAAMPERTD